MIGSSTKLARLAALGMALIVTVVPLASADTVGEILAMLDGGISEQTIIDWLEAGGETLDRPSAGELVELKSAGASEELLRAVLARGRPPASAATLSPPQPVAPAAPPEDVVEPAAGGEGTQVEFRLRYSPRFDEGEEPWDLIVYLDGYPLSYVPAGDELLGLTAAKPVEFRIELSPGQHTLRVLQERHERRRRAWRHGARAAATPFVFELAGDSAAEASVEFRQGWGDLTDPLTFRFAQGNRVVDIVEVGGDPERWPELCEDAGRQPPDDGCIAWTSLWSGSEVPARAEVLDLLARFEFRPLAR